MVSILDAHRVELGLDRWDYNLADHQGYFDRKTLVLPDVLLPSEFAPEQALRPGQCAHGQTLPRSRRLAVAL
jgi:hypothetical protein